MTFWGHPVILGEDTVEAGPADLHVLAAQGRPDAIEALLRQLRPVIVRYVRARLARAGSQDEDDVTQEVCLALLAALPSYRDMGRPFVAFVFAIAAHKVADAARGAARSPLPVPVLPDRPDRCPGPEETVVASVDARQARILLAHLPDGQRRLLLLQVVGGFPPKTPGTYWTCHRARSVSPSTGRCSGCARSPPPGQPPEPGAGRAPHRGPAGTNQGTTGPAVSGLNRMKAFPLPLPVKVP